MLPITLAGVKLLCGLTDTSQDAAITALIALAQPAWEYALDPAALANAGSDTGLGATLTLGVTEALAGNYLATLGRPPQWTQTFRLSTLEVSTRPANDPAKLGALLAAQGAARLAPFARAARALARTAAGGDQNLDDPSPVPLLLGAALGPQSPSAGPPTDGDFDRVLGTDGHTEPPSGDLFTPGGFGVFTDFVGGPEP